MGDNEYKISLGVDLNEAELNSIKKILQSIEDQKRDVVYNVDFNIKNLDKLTKVGSEIEKIKDQINNIGSSKKVDAAIPIDSKQIETSLNKIHDSIKKLQNAFGKVDKNKGVQSLLTTVNKIGKSLESVSKQFEGLNKNLSNFAGKEFSINLDFGLGKSGSKSSEQIVQEFNILRKEAEEYEKYFGKIYSSAKSGTDTNRNAIFNLVSKYDRKNLSYLLGLSNTVHTGDGASQKRNAALKEYIRLIKEAAAIGKISLEPVEFRLAESSDFVKTKKEVSETEEKLKELFSGGVNADNLHKALNNIYTDLHKITEIIDNLSSDISINEIISSFNGFSEAIEKLKNNCVVMNSVVSDSMNNVGSSVGQSGGVENLEQDLKQVTVAAENAADAIKETKNASKNISVSNLADSFKEVDITIEATEDQLTNLWKALKGVGFNDSAVDDITNDFKELGITIKNVTSRLNSDGSVKVTAKGFNQYGDVVTAMNNIDKDGNRSSWSTSIQREFNETEEAYKRLLSLTKEINGLDLKIAGLDADKNANEIAELTSRLNEFKSEYNELFAVTKTNLTDNQIDNLTQEYTEAASKLDVVNAKLTDTNEKLAENIRIKLQDTGFNGFEAEMHRVKAAAESLDMSYDDLNASLKQLDIAMEAVDSADQAGDIKRLVAANDEYEASLKQVISLLKGYQQAEKDAFNAKRLKQSKASLSSDMEIWLKENTRATREFGEEVRRLQASLDGLDANGLKIAKQQFDNIKKTTKALGKDGLTVFDRLKSKAKEYMTYLSAAEMFMYAEQALRSMFEQVKLIDSAMTELKKVTNETDASYNQFLSNAASRAKEIGTTIDGLVSSTADFARLGYDFKDAQELAEVANIYAVVGDEIDSVETATESLISTMTAFGVKASDSMGIVDKFNEVGNNFAISSGGIGEALERSASSMAAANNSLDETIALITAANTVVQDADSVGTAFKTISMRIRGATTDLEEAGLDTEGMASSTAKLREEIMALSGVDIMLDSTTFKSTYKIMEELAAKWEHLTDIQQASITELIAGKRQGNIVSSLMTNFDIAQDALATSLDSSGSAMEEHEKYMDSIEAKLSQLKAAWQSFAQTFMSSDLLKGGIDALKTFVDILEVLVDNFGLLGTIGLGTVGTGAFKYFKSLKDIGADVIETVTNVVDTVEDIGDAVDDVTDIIDPLADCTDIFDEAGKSIPNMIDAVDDASDAMGNLGGVTTKTGGSLKAFMKTPLGVASAIGLIVAAVGLAINAYKNYREEQSKLRQETIKTSDEFLDAASSFEQAYIKYSGRTDLTSDEEAELQAAINGTVTALDDKSSALQSAVDSSNDYLASLEAIKNAELKAAKDAAETKRDEAELALEEAAMGWGRFDGSEVNVSLGSGSVGNMSEEQRIASEIADKYFGRSRKNIGKAKQTTYTLTLSSDASTDEIIDYYYMLMDYQQKLEDSNLKDTSAYTNTTNAINKMSEFIGIYIDGVYEAVKANYQLSEGIPKTAEEYVRMREAILNSDDIKNKSFDTKLSIANSLDSEYKQLFDLSDAEIQARKFVGIINGYNDGIDDGTNEIGTVETFLNMRTAVNNDECSVGDYLSQFNEINALTKDWSDKEKEEFNLAFGLNTDAIKEQYDNVYNYLSRNYLNKLDTTGMDSNEIQSFMAVNSSAIRQFLNELSASELSALVGIKAEIDWKNTSAEDVLKQIQKEVDLQEALNFSADIKIDTTALEVLNTALSESASAIGLSSESIDGLQSRYAKLDNYDPSALFERTANGVKINREELEKLEKEYNDLTKTEVEEHLNNLVDEYNNLTSEIDKCTNAGERAQLISEREGYAKKIEELATYQAQLEGVTGAYQDWIDAQSASEDYEGYESVATSREGIKEEIDRGFIGNKSKKYIDLLSGTDLTGANIDDYAAAWDNLSKKVTETGYSVNDFFTINDDGDITATGIDRFFTSLQTEFKGKVYRWNNETQSWYYDFSQENLKAIQDQWGIGIEAIELLLEAAASAGYDIDWGGILDGIDLDTSDFETLVSIAESAQAAFNELEGVDDVSFNFTATGVKEATSELEKARTTYIDLITNNDGSINLEANGAAEMRVMLSTLLIQKQQLEDSTISINIDTSGLDESQQDIADAIEAVKNFREKYKNLEIAVTTGQGIEEAKTELNTAMTELQGLGDAGIDIATKLMLGEDANGATLKSQLSSAIEAVGSPDIEIGCKLSETAIGSLNSQILTNFTPEATVKITGIDDTLVGEYTSTEKTAHGTVTWDNDDELVIQFQNETHLAQGIVNWGNNDENVQKYFSANGTVKWTSGNKVKVDVISEATGTANAGGTTGRAFVRGNWGIKGSGTALGGELGQELVVRDGKFFTIGDKGAEFFHYKPNDIIFNAAQTESLFKYGGIKGAKPRGTMLASGSAFAGGSRPSSGRAFPWSAEASESDFANKRNNGSLTIKADSVNVSGDTGKNSSTGKTYNSSKTNNDSNDKKEEFEETFDWIEIAIARIERAIDRLDTKANSTYRNWSERNKALVGQIGEVNDEITLQQQAYDRYMAAANGVGLSSSWANKVRNGKVDIETIQDEALAEKIKDYQNWYEKALACEDAILELRETESSLYAQRFENVQTQYDGILQGYEHTESMLNEYISQAEEQGYIVSKKYYDALVENEKSNIAELQRQQSALIKSRDEAVASGAIAKYSEEWYNMCGEIDSVTQAIEEGKTALLEYARAMEEIDWSIFDLAQERISNITEEAEFFIELMSSGKLFDDNGKFTNQGIATVGLHAQNYNSQMYAADDYGKEVANLNTQISKDPYDQELIKRRDELLELQRESILAAEDEKNAIRDLVEEGINLELDALQERIDKYNDSIDAAKDLYDYQKKVKEQTQEIASLEKQMSAYAGDTSEEAKAKIQELKVSLEDAKSNLEETEYEKYISDQKQMLDELYLEYEVILNTRLDNIDALIADMIAEVNSSSGIIAETIFSSADKVGYTMSAEMQGIWAQAYQNQQLESAKRVEQVTAILNRLVENGKLSRQDANSIIAKLGAGDIQSAQEAANLISKLTENGKLSQEDASKIIGALTSSTKENKDVVTTYGKDFSSKITTTNDILNGIKTGINDMIVALNKESQSQIQANKTTTSAQKNPTATSTSTPASTPTSTPTPSKSSSSSGSSSGGDGVAKVGDKVKFISGKYYYDSEGKSPAGSKNQGKEVYITSINTRSWATHPYHISTGKQLGSGDLGWLKLNQLSGYASGKRRISNNQYAWTQENGQEYIVRPSDGAILTPVAQNDSVLNATASSNIWKMANSPADFIRDNLDLGLTNIPNNSNTQSSYVQHFENITFSMPNVHGYNELLAEMQRDPKFEKLILSMSIDRIAGKSGLAKNKSIR